MREFLDVHDINLVYGSNSRAPFDRERVLSVLKKDMSVCTESDVISYYVACNTWVLYASDMLGSEAGDALYVNIARDGLTSAIEQASTLYDLYRADDTFWSDGNPQQHVDFTLWVWAPLFNGSRDTVLRVLCYPRRFVSPSLSASLKDASLAKFLGVNQQCLDFERDNLKACGEAERWGQMFVRSTLTPPLKISSYLLKKLRAVYARIFRGVDDLTLYSFDDLVMHGHFSTGATQEVTRRESCVGEKMNYFVPYDEYFGTSFSKLPCCGDHRYWETTWKRFNGYDYPWGTLHKGTSRDYSEIVAVAKTYKANRIIAIESTVNGYAQQAAMRIMYEQVTDSRLLNAYHMNDQSFNRYAAWLGAYSGWYATLDLSSASDSISREFIRMTFPSRIYKSIMRFASSYAEVDGKMYRLGTLLTSGTALTSFIQSIVFYGICEVGSDTVQLHYPRTEEEHIRHPFIFNDDCIVDVRAYDCVCEMLTECGFTVNASKSFTDRDGSYRESCGIEAYNGYKYEPIYYPRKGLQVSNPAQFVSQLVELQKKFFWTSPAVAGFLEKCVLSIAPWMTYSQAGANCSDLWGSQDRANCSYSPYAQIIEVPIGCETLRVLVPMAQRSESYLDSHAHLIGKPIVKGLSKDSIANTDNYLYSRWLASPPELEEVPYMDDKIFVYPAGVSRDKALYPIELGWVIQD